MGQESEVSHPRGLASYIDLIEFMFSLNLGNADTCTSEYGICYLETKGRIMASSVFPMFIYLFYF